MIVKGFDAPDLLGGPMPNESLKDDHASRGKKYSIKILEGLSYIIRSSQNPKSHEAVKSFLFDIYLLRNNSSSRGIKITPLLFLFLIDCLAGSTEGSDELQTI